MGMDRVTPAPTSIDPGNREHSTANPAHADRRAVFRIRGNILIRGVLHRIGDLFFSDPTLDVIDEEMCSIFAVPADPPPSCHSTAQYIPYVYTSRIYA